MLLKAGCDPSETGIIGFNPEFIKYSTSNVIGAAARHAHAEIINFMIDKTNDKSMLEFKAIETGGYPN